MLSLDRLCLKIIHHSFRLVSYRFIVTLLLDLTRRCYFLFDFQAGLIMYYNRANKPGCQERISSVLDVLWKVNVFSVAKEPNFFHVLYMNSPPNSKAEAKFPNF